MFSLGVYTSTRALDPQKSTDNPSANQGESAPKTKSVPLSKSKKMSDPFNKLSLEESKVIIGKGTERAGVGKYTSFKAVTSPARNRPKAT